VTGARARRDRILIWMCAMIAFTNAVARTGALFNVVPVLAHDRLDLATDQIGVGLALASVVGLALAYPAGVMVDRYGRKIVIGPSTIIAGASLVVSVAAPITLGLATDLAGANTTLAATAVALTAVALVFAWRAPETYGGARL